MAKKYVEVKVVFEVEDGGDMDLTALVATVDSGINLQNEMGTLTPDEAESTVILSWHASLVEIRESEG